MSYILDALKKSDQQRQRGATPTLQVVQVTVAAPGRPISVYYGLLAAVLLVTGIVIGWLHPWQPEQPSQRLESIVADTSSSIPQQAAPMSVPMPMVAPPAMPVSPVQDSPARDKPARLAGDGLAQETILLDELTVAIRQELPAMEVQLHAYASVPSERLASINSIRLREGGYLMAGLRLEQVTPDGLIFSYKGYRFRRGIR